MLEFVPPGETKKDIPRDLYVYFNDIHTCVKQADLLLGDLTYNSFGLGWEMGTACKKHGTPILMCHKKEHSISSIARGAAMVHKNITIFPYKKSITETECLEFLIEKIKTYAKNSGYITEEEI